MPATGGGKSFKIWGRVLQHLAVSKGKKKENTILSNFWLKIQTYSGKTAIFELSYSISVFQKMTWSDFQLKLQNKGGAMFFEWREEFQNAGQIFTPEEWWSVKKDKLQIEIKNLFLPFPLWSTWLKKRLYANIFKPIKIWGEHFFSLKISWCQNFKITIFSKQRKILKRIPQILII